MRQRIPFVLIMHMLSVACMSAALGLHAAVPIRAEAQAGTQPRFKALVFSGTAGFRHASIEAGVDAIRGLGADHSFLVAATEDPGVFTSDSLDSFDVVVFLNTSGDVLDAAQQTGFEKYVRAGGGFAGIHGASATEYDWSWYGDLVGAFFDNHPTPQQAVVEVMDRVHPSTRNLPGVWERFDEWYNFRTTPRGDVHVLAVLEEKSYEGGEMGHDHPIAWAHEFEGSRSWYTALGHTSESYEEPEFLVHMLGGIEWAAGAVPGAADATIASSFEKVVLMSEMTDPMEMGIDRQGRVFVAERSGPVKMFDPTTGETALVGSVPVRMTIEDGLLGLTLDPSFEENGWIYVYYAPADGGPQRLARWTFDGEQIDPATEKILLEIPTQQQECCHSGGSLTFGPDGNLYLSTGDNTNPYPLGGSPIDERPGLQYRVGDAQRTSANTNDLRGKILRISPLPDGTYEIPEGNLFEGDALHRPEIYTMGHRNPYRISVDPDTGWLYWGDVGIGNAPSETRGPWGWEEFNQAREPGFYGWPYFAGPNDAYRDFDYVTQTPGDTFNAKHPVNESPNNTGARELPPARPALIWYTYGPSEEFPELGSGGMSAMAGPVYRYDGTSASPRALPEYYDGSFFIYEWMRHWVQEVKFDENGRVLEVNPFLPGMEFVRPTDMEVGPDGRLYVIEWGETFWGSNEDAQVVRLDYYGTAPRPTSVQTASQRDASPPVRFTWPPDGAIFDYLEPIAFETEGGEDVIVEPFTGHDTHAHSLEPVRGTKGEVVITRQFTHVPDLHYMNRFAVLEARPADGAGPADHVVLRPRIVEAEHASSTTGAKRQTYGKHAAESDFAEAALTVMQVQAGGHLEYAPLNLVGIDTVLVRVKPVPGARLDVRLDGLDGRLLESVEVDSTSGDAVRRIAPSGWTGRVVTGEVLAGLPEGVRPNYAGWRDVRIPVPEGVSSNKLFLAVKSDAMKGVVLYVDRLEFLGEGASMRPDALVAE